MARDFETGFGRRYMLAAGRRSGIVAGYALAAIFRAFVTWTVLTAVALIAGMNVGGGAGEIVALYALAVLVNVAATMWAAGVALRVRSIQGGPLMQFPVFLILFLAPVYVPLDLLSGWIHAVASINPVTALLEAGRGFISGDPVVVVASLRIGISPHRSSSPSGPAAACAAPKPPAKAAGSGPAGRRWVGSARHSTSSHRRDVSGGPHPPPPHRPLRVI